jgi:hypothetical protein
MTQRSELTWEIICFLYRDEEEDALTIASSLMKSRSEVNSILYCRRDLFTKRDSPYSARPLWSLTHDGIKVYDLVYDDSDDEVIANMPLFCDDCGSLLPTHNPTCSEFTLGEYKQHIPSNVNYGKVLGLAGFFGIRYSEEDTDLDVENRREVIVEFLITAFVPVKSNTTYVKSYGEPRTPNRKLTLINHLEGINVPSTSRIKQLRNEDISWLKDLDFEKDLP